MYAILLFYIMISGDKQQTGHTKLSFKTYHLLFVID